MLYFFNNFVLHFSMLIVMASKLLCSKLSITIITILFQSLEIEIIATCSHFIGNLILANMLITNFLNLLGLIFLR